MQKYLVTATHPHPDYRFDATEVGVHGDAEKFYATHPKLGCGKSRATPEAAIRHLFQDHACILIKVEVAP